MGDHTNVRTAILDVALSNSEIDGGDALGALCDEHIGATQRAIDNNRPLLDWPEFKEATL